MVRAVRGHHLFREEAADSLHGAKAQVLHGSPPLTRAFERPLTHARPAQANADEFDDLAKYRTTSKPFFLVFKDGEHERSAVRSHLPLATLSNTCRLRVQGSRSS